MSQVYLQRFEYRAAAKSEFDQAWTTALQTFARTGNWGGAETGIRHVKSYGTAWGGYVLIEVDDANAFARYQLHHSLNYGHMVQITFEPIFDLDASLEHRVREMRTQEISFGPCSRQYRLAFAPRCLIPVRSLDGLWQRRDPARVAGWWG